MPGWGTYMQLFCDDKRAEYKEVNPDAGFSEMPALLAAAWKEAIRRGQGALHRQERGASWDAGRRIRQGRVHACALPISRTPGT